MKTIGSLQLPVWSDPERMSGQVCFEGTRVPVDALFDNLEAGMSIQEFLTEFEGVSREQVVAVLEFARRSLSPNRSAAA
jgi:uncharacterized protein (DUF433 family)